MPSFRSFTLSADVSDGFRTLADLFGSATLDSAIVEGILQAQDGAIVMRFGDASKPVDTDAGITFVAGAGMGLGPVVHRDAAWPLSRIWVRREVAGVAARVTAVGTVV